MPAVPGRGDLVAPLVGAFSGADPDGEVPPKPPVGRLPPPKPPRAPTTAGPAVGDDPVDAVVTVCTVYAAGPASTAAIASPDTPRRRLPPMACETSSPAPGNTPAASTAQRSQGRKSALRESSTNDQTPVRKEPAAKIGRA